MKNLVILDIDETLIHSCLKDEINGKLYDFIFEKYFVFKRPYLDNFIAYCYENFDIAVWSAGTNDYVNFIVSQIFPNPSELHFIWSRENCTVKNNLYFENIYLGDLSEYPQITHFKNLSKVKKKGYKLENIFFIDDRAEGHTKNYGNLVLVQPYYGEQDDKELMLLTNYLDYLKEQPNVRKIEKRGWRNLLNITNM